jgi:hypothetical protein
MVSLALSALLTLGAASLLAVGADRCVDLDRSGQRLGPQTLTWPVPSGDWTVMVMNADAAVYASRSPSCR